MLRHQPKRKDPNKVTEASITAQIRYYLRVKRVFHYKAWQGLGSTPGVPDIVGVLPGGRSLFIEIKTPKGKLSPAQEDFLRNAEELGALAFVARSVEDVQAKGL